MQLLSVWGNAEQVDLAEKQVAEWIDELMPKHAGARWAKLQNLSDKQKRRLEKRLRLEEEQNLYRRNPPAGLVPNWTVSDYTVNWV